MGNCDTHVFLGSNSYKTVEYFSKALGEKTITRDSRSINRDKQYHRQGYSDSDQVMARALMTPDELRRMDNDDCIIYEKGIKPVKAKKYYYFESPMARKLAEYTLSHLDFNVGDRGKWRKYNPYNPYIEENENVPKNDLKVESLDDLFADDIVEEPKEENTKQGNLQEQPITIQNDQEIEVENTVNNIEPKTGETKGVDLDAPMLPQEPERDEVFSIDVQKELEAKFDELFGPLDDEDNK